MLNPINVPTMFVEPICPGPEVPPTPFYGQTVPELLSELQKGGWEIESQLEIGVFFVVNGKGVCLVLYTVEAMNMRASSRVWNIDDIRASGVLNDC